MGLVADVNLGSAVGRWTPEYLSSHAETASMRVSAHVFLHDKGLMDFVHKNFQFHTMPFAELIQRCAGSTALPPLIQSGERYYLRSIGKNPRKVQIPSRAAFFQLGDSLQERAWIDETFPLLAEDLKLPGFVVQEHLFSTVLRVSSAHVQLWTHFDVMDNLLIQVTGTKTVRFWPPSADPCLYVTNSSSEVIDIEDPDLTKYPDFHDVQSMELTLKPGDVLYIPALWFHNVKSESFAVSVNAFFRHLPVEFYDRRDLYGNRDPVAVQSASKFMASIFDSLSAVPDDFRRFYGDRLRRQLEQFLATGDPREGR